MEASDCGAIQATEAAIKRSDGAGSPTEGYATHRRLQIFGFDENVRKWGNEK